MVKTKNILTIDVGGTHVKILTSNQTEARRFSSGPKLTPQKMVSGVLALTKDWDYDCISIGYPGPVANGNILLDPHNLGKGWKSFDFAKALSKPVKLANDAVIQALGSYKGGKLLFLGIGTGLGSAMIVNDTPVPMELAHLPYCKATFEDYVGQRGINKFGKKRWRKHVAIVVELFRAALEPEDLVLGGGNIKYLDSLPKNVRAGENANAFVGGFRLWQNETKTKK